MKTILRWVFSFLFLYVNFTYTRGVAQVTTPIKAQLEKIYLNELKKSVRKYRQYPSAIFDLEKQIEPLVGDPTKLSGQVFFKKGKVKLEITKPKDQRSLFLSTPQKILIVNFLPKELGGKVQVTEIKPSQKLKQSQDLFGLLMGGDQLWSELQILSREVKGRVIVYHLKPKKGSSIKNIENLKIVTNKLELAEIRYTDEIENTVIYKISNLNTSKILSEKEFKFNIPKDATITRY